MLLPRQNRYGALQGLSDESELRMRKHSCMCIAAFKTSSRSQTGQLRHTGKSSIPPPSQWHCTLLRTPRLQYPGCAETISNRHQYRAETLQKPVLDIRTGDQPVHR